MKSLRSILPGIKLLNGSVDKASVGKFDSLRLNHGLVLLMVCQGTSSKLTLGFRRRQWPKRRRSVGYWRSLASPG
jgi:hypothetical protein